MSVDQAVETVSSLVSTVAKKRKLDPTARGLDAIIEALRTSQQQSPGAGASGVERVGAQVNVQELQDQVKAHHKELLSSVTKLGKGIDKALGAQLHLPVDKLSSKLVVEAVHRHLVSEGAFDAASLMGPDVSGQRDGAVEISLREMHAVLVALQAEELQPALEWLELHREALRARGSTLELTLRRLQFVQLLRAGELPAAVKQAREHLAPAAAAAKAAAGGSFAAPRMGGGVDADPEVAVRRLLGSLGFANRLERSPYARELLSPALWSAGAKHFEHECLGMLGMPCDSPLRIAVDAGAQVLPTLLKLASVLGSKQQTAWQSGDQLPVELELPAELRFHSVFTCPVSKEAATADNPPMMLPCGHVLSLGSIAKLARGSRSVRFKCPYCPAECSTAMAKALVL